MAHPFHKSWTLAQHEQVCIVSVIMSTSLVELTVIILKGTHIAVASDWGRDGFRAKIIRAARTPVETIKDSQVG